MTCAATLEQLVGIAPDDFVANYWERQPLHVPGDPDKLERLGLSPADFRLFDALDAATADSEVQCRVARIDDQGVHRHCAIEPHRHRHRAPDSTLCVTGLQCVMPSVARLLGQVQAGVGVGGPALTSCFVSPPGQGARMHFDTQSVFAIGMQGRKIWRISTRSAHPAPRATVLEHTDGANLASMRAAYPDAVIHHWRDRPLREISLGPGDVLYLPSGVWHEVTAEEDSVGLSLMIAGTRAVDLVAQILADASGSEEDSHTPLPSVSPREGRAAAVRQVDAQLAALRRFVADLTPDDLRQAWSGEVGFGGAPVRDMPKAPAVAADTELWRDTSFPLRWSERGDHLEVIHGPTRVALPRSAKGFVARLATSVCVRATTAVHWSGTNEPYPLDAVVGVLAHLCQTGILRVGVPRPQLLGTLRAPRRAVRV